MSWPVRSRLLVRTVVTVTGGTVQLLGAVPAGKTWLLKDFAVYNAAAGTNTITFGSKVAGSFANAAVVGPVGASQLGTSIGRALVFPAGYELYCTTSVTGQIQVHVSGAELG